MSVLRLLSSSRAGQSLAGPSSRRLDDIKLELHLPTFGTVYMKPPDDPLWPHGRSAGPRDDQLLNGVLEVHIPSGMGSKRCKSIRVGARTKSMLHLGPGRGWEEDVIFERKVEILGANADGIVLDEGIQRFEFTLILPSTFAPHDWHKNGKVRQELYAEMEGIPPPTPSSPLANMFRRPASLSSSKRGSFSSSSRTPSRSPSPHSSPRYSPLNLSPMLTAAASFSITRQEEASFPLVPSYEESQADAKGAGSREKDDWVVGVHEVVRNITVLHNPNPAGNFSDLDERQNGFAPGIGVWDLKIFSDVFSIGGPIHARLTLPDLDPKISIFSWRLLLEQTHTISSPRDDPDVVKPIPHTVIMDIMERGSRPPLGVKHPGIEDPALWRGTEAGGEAQGECQIQGNAFMPKDDRARPTTLPGIITPIKVSHALVYEVYFSVLGEDDQGAAMVKPGPGGLRVLRVKKPIILPSCGLIPTLLDLPQYSQVQSGGPCLDCGTRPGDQICLTCPPTTVPHARHDPEFLESRCGTGRCETCSIRFAPCLAPEAQNYCACGLGIEDIEMRMKKFAFEGVRTDFERERMTRQKEVDERGRRRDRSGSRPRR